MSKSDTLLKKATFFERMALYSDRKVFLKSLAQSGASDEWPAAKSLPADIAQGVNSVMKDLAATKPDSSVPLQNRLQSFYLGTNTDMGQLAQALSEAANTIPGDHTTQVQNALALADKVRQMSAQPQQQPEEAAGEPMTMPAAHITCFRPIDKKDQEAVFRFVTLNGLGVPGQVDGKLGKETRTALEAIKDYFAKANPQNKRMSDQEAIQAAKFQGR